MSENYKNLMMRKQLEKMQELESENRRLREENARYLKLIEWVSDMSYGGGRSFGQTEEFKEALHPKGEK